MRKRFIRKRSIHRHAYWYLVPIIALLAFGILARTADRINQTQVLQSDPNACSPIGTTGMVDWNAKVGYYEGQQFSVPLEALAENDEKPTVLGLADPSERWIEVDLSDQTLRAWDGNKLYLETKISSGLPGTPTPTGEFHVWMKIRATRMTGGEGRLAYDLPNVPYVMFFQNDAHPSYLGYGLHGTYWHNDFGRTHSHGCVNLPTPIAKDLYSWTSPVMPDGVNMIRASDDNPGTRIVIHE